MDDLEKSILDFEKVCGCKIVIHDIVGIFSICKGGKCVKRLFNIEAHRDHRQVFSCRQKSASPTPCVRHCVVKLRQRVSELKEPLYFNRCPFGMFELAAPVFRHGSLMVVFFAGMWERPLDRDKIQRISTLLPVFAEGMTGRAEAVRRSNLQADESDKYNTQQQILSYINSHYMHDVSVASLAKHMSLSVSRMCHLVHASLGKSFSKLLTEARISNARTLLDSTDCRISEIAEMSGFNSVEHFIRTFKKTTGISPNAYRNDSGKKVRKYLKRRTGI